jgi:hypothetical protein
VPHTAAELPVRCAALAISRAQQFHPGAMPLVPQLDTVPCWCMQYAASLSLTHLHEQAGNSASHPNRSFVYGLRTRLEVCSCTALWHDEQTYQAVTDSKAGKHSCIRTTNLLHAQAGPQGRSTTPKDRKEVSDRGAWKCTRPQLLP